jgi:pilus assembly protein CpaE
VTSNRLTNVRVLILRDALPGAVYESEDAAERPQLLLDHPRLTVSVSTAGYGEAIRAGERYRPDIVLLDGVLSDPAQLVAELDEALHRTPVLVILDEADRDRVHDCVAAGARGCLVRPVDTEALAQTIFRVHDRALRQRQRQDAELQASGAVARGGRIISVRGAKGGVGGTVIATNMAVAMKRLSGLRVALLDAHFFGGDVPMALDIVSNSSIADLIPHLHTLDDELLDKTLVKHASGISVLAVPSEFERAEAITADEFQRVIEALRARFDYVVIDCSPFLDQNSLLVLDMSDLLLLVSTPEIVALKNAARLIQLGADLGYSESKMRLVVNRLKSPGAISRNDFERHLDYHMSFGIPNDTAVVRALTRGVPVVTYERTSKAARALEKLARAAMSNEGWAGERTEHSGRRLLRLPSLRLPRPAAQSSLTSEKPRRLDGPASPETAL